MRVPGLGVPRLRVPRLRVPRLWVSRLRVTGIGITLLVMARRGIRVRGLGLIRIGLGRGGWLGRRAARVGSHWRRLTYPVGHPTRLRRLNRWYLLSWCGVGWGRFPIHRRGRWLGGMPGWCRRRDLWLTRAALRGLAGETHVLVDGLVDQPVLHLGVLEPRGRGPQLLGGRQVDDHPEDGHEKEGHHVGDLVAPQAVHLEVHPEGPEDPGKQEYREEQGGGGVEGHHEAQG